MTTPIHDFLKKYANFGLERCHMPGHKGIEAKSDITEIDGAVNIIKESERNAAELFGAERTLFSTSGSTLAISAMLSGVASSGVPASPGGFSQKRITAFRGAHRSLIDTAILLGFDIDWVYPGDSVDDCISNETAAIFATSIDYYGNMAALPLLPAVPDSPPILVDNAHGAYLVFTDMHPIRLGAAMSADSAHKTLPALTGSAYLHIAKDCSGECAMRANEAMLLFGTSSPSYLILESLDLCNLHIANEKSRAEAAFSAVASLKEKLSEIGYNLHKSDLLRVTTNVNLYGYTGVEYAKQLRNRGIVCEMYDSQYVILLFSTITQEKNTQRVFEAMRDIPKKQTVCSFSFTMPRAKQATPLRNAYFSRKRTIPVNESIGEVCAGVHVSIPPCAPFVIPGEIISDEIALLLEKSGIYEVDVILQ